MSKLMYWLAGFASALILMAMAATARPKEAVAERHDPYDAAALLVCQKTVQEQKQLLGVFEEDLHVSVEGMNKTPKGAR